MSSNESLSHYIKKLESHFANEIGESRLMWCRFKTKPDKKSLSDIKQWSLENNKKVYFYLERSSEIYETFTEEILLYIQELEPWIDIDAYIFDETLNWIIAFTHDEEWLTIGL